MSETLYHLVWLWDADRKVKYIRHVDTDYLPNHLKCNGHKFSTADDDFLLTVF